MTPLLTRAEVRAIDAAAVARLGLPSIVLMENAGRGATEQIALRFADRLTRVVVVAGPGQNGGDGWVVARHLRNRGLEPRCVLVGESARVRGDARTNLEVLRAMGVTVREAGGDPGAVLDEVLAGATLVVDALFGTGLDRPVEGPYAIAVERIDRADAPVVALDLPSGIDADRGQELGVAVHATLTVTFAAHKRGLYQHPGAAHAGEIACVSIGVPAPRGALAARIDPEDVARALPRRAPDVHKGVAGRVLVVAGSPGRTGAAMLSGLGALRGGAGLVTLAARGRAREALDQKVVELHDSRAARRTPRARSGRPSPSPVVCRPRSWALVSASTTRVRRSPVRWRWSCPCPRSSTRTPSPPSRPIPPC